MEKAHTTIQMVPNTMEIEEMINKMGNNYK